jgi:hypothetical protein
MIVLIPWKPVVVIWLLLSAMLWCGYVGSSLIEEKNPFAPYTIQAVHARPRLTQCGALNPADPRSLSAIHIAKPPRDPHPWRGVRA